MAAVAGLGVAVAGRSLLLRSGALGAGHRRERLLGGRADPSHHRADRAAGRRGRGPHRLLPGASRLRGLPVPARSPRPAPASWGPACPVDTHAIPVRVRRPGRSPWWNSTPTCWASANPAPSSAPTWTRPPTWPRWCRWPRSRSPAICSTRASILGSGTGSSGWTPTATSIYASPNALSAYRRLGLIGDLVDEHLATLTAKLLPPPSGPVDDSVQSVLSGRIARRAEAVAGSAHLLLRSVPLPQRTSAARRHRAVP